LVETRFMSVRDVASKLQSENPLTPGLSYSTVARYCHRNDIKIKKPLSDDCLDSEIKNAIDQVGPTYGRKMMNGLLASSGVSVCEGRVGRSLARVNPIYHTSRQEGSDKIKNTKAYFSPHFGHNQHIDQHEKMVMFGITFVILVDGCSGYVLSFSVMPIKCNTTIYEEVYMPPIQEFGLWECLLADWGRENFLVCFMQEYYRDRCPSACGRLPYRQITSTSSRVERLWEEVVRNIGYPMKNCLQNLEATSNISSSDPNCLYAISTVGMLICRQALTNWRAHWNSHAIPKSGRPDSYIRSRRNIKVPAGVLLSTAEAKQTYEDAGGQLSQPSIAGTDMVVDVRARVDRDIEFNERLALEVGDATYIFGRIVNHVYHPMHDAVKLFLSVSQRYT